MREPKIYEMAGGYGFRMDIGVDPKTGKRRQARFGPFRTKTIARQERARLIAEIAAGTYIEPAKIYLGDYISEWLEKKKNEVEESTFHQYESYCRNHIMPDLGRIKMQDLKPIHFQRFLNDLAKKDLSDRSRKHIYSILRNALNDAVDLEMIPKNSSKAVKAPTVKKKEMKVWTRDEVNRFLEHAKGERYYAAFLIAIMTGMRPNEYLGLSWKGVNFENNTITVLRGLKRHVTHTFYLANITKTSSSYRTIPVDKYTMSVLKRLKVRQNEEKLAATEYNDQDLVIATQNGNFVLPSNLTREFNRIIKKAKVPRIPLYNLRHTHATLLFTKEKPAHPKVVQERLGHASITTTLETYSHVLPSLSREVADEFGEYIFGNSGTNLAHF